MILIYKFIIIIGFILDSSEKCLLFKVKTMHNKSVIEKLQNGRTTNEFERQLNGVCAVLAGLLPLNDAQM